MLIAVAVAFATIYCEILSEAVISITNKYKVIKNY